MSELSPIPENERGRLLKLSDLDIDYSDVNESLKDLATLAAKVAGTSISLVNLIDSFTQWTVSNYGFASDPISREDSVCQYTIASRESFEVKNLAEDSRFKDKFYVSGPPNLRYYLGVPLQTSDGFNLGALCVLETSGRETSPEKIELLKIIAREIVSRLTTFEAIRRMKNHVRETTESQRKVAHDIRGPLGGIISLAEIIRDQGDDNKMDEVLEFIGLIQKSGKSLLELADEILSIQEAEGSSDSDKPALIGTHELNLHLFKEKLLRLYAPQAVSKGINFHVVISGDHEHSPFPKNKLLQIAGNLLSNALKFTPGGGSVTVHLDLKVEASRYILQIQVADTGTGLTQETIHSIMHESASTTQGTQGETGYGFGLELVKHLVAGLHGTLSISSEAGKGATFTVLLPLKQ